MYRRKDTEKRKGERKLKREGRERSVKKGRKEEYYLRKGRERKR